jgi:hypothetical protein
MAIDLPHCLVEVVDFPGFDWPAPGNGWQFTGSLHSSQLREGLRRSWEM